MADYLHAQQGLSVPYAASLLLAWGLGGVPGVLGGGSVGQAREGVGTGKGRGVCPDVCDPRACRAAARGARVPLGQGHAKPACLPRAPAPGPTLTPPRVPL